MNNFYYNVDQRRTGTANRTRLSNMSNMSNMSNLTGITNISNTRRGEFLNDLIELRLTPNSFLYLPYIQWASILKNRSATKIQRWYRRIQAFTSFVDR